MCTNINYKRLKRLLAEYEAFTNKVAKEIICELKRDSQTYRQVDKKLMMFKKEIGFEHQKLQRNEHVFSEVKRLIEEEKNDLQLTNKF